MTVSLQPLDDSADKDNNNIEKAKDLDKDNASVGEIAQGVHPDL
jgi:hypothetical protein